MEENDVTGYLTSPASRSGNDTDGNCLHERLIGWKRPGAITAESVDFLIRTRHSYRFCGA
ncbi:uncharacterized protein PADG_12118 [Paracoccidioides brasiliensis Pb18]|uniref:Uncharacterized protein n=1 Tax=Paracoccidioides brasiliensis (strain Pb18) TaxID=502780 RepID=A0A0A0HU28_PARBD|nr:uncharacterized protein PADG_12118 [Paracoccidioides brasiliensis Pb18]KGM91803.1 hypothetical protein PADG_12118 [Paracoccidioides brasiliensis Pb18]